MAEGTATGSEAESFMTPQQSCDVSFTADPPVEQPEALDGYEQLLTTEALRRSAVQRPDDDLALAESSASLVTLAPVENGPDIPEELVRGSCPLSRTRKLCCVRVMSSARSAS
jgi:hypothetical protein